MKKKKLFIGFLLIGVGIILVIFLFTRFFSFSSKKTNDFDRIQIKKNGNFVDVYRNGSVIFKSPKGEMSETWEKGKVDAFFKYFINKYLDSSLIEGGENSVSFFVGGEERKYSLSDDDELADIVTGGEGSGGGGQEDQGGGVSDYFNNPQQTSTPTVTPRPTNPPSGGGGGGDDTCLYWRLSYCVIWSSPSPTPTPTGPSIALPPTCEDTRNRITGRTVITNELCAETNVEEGR